jgi:rubrerythrin
MDKEQNKTIEALQFAIQMEIDGKEFYTKAGAESKSKVGKDLFEWLSGEEDKHRLRFEQIYDEMKASKKWPDIPVKREGDKSIKTLFSDALQRTGRTIQVDPSELELVDKAIDMEDKTYNFYKSTSDSASYEAEKIFYESVAIEERGHYLMLTDYKEYIIDPAGWFTKSEHHSMDGG